MTDRELLILIGGVDAAIAWWVFFFLYRSYRLDVLRHNLFFIRDNLFMRAAAGEFGFDSPAYTHARGMLNALIRYADELSILNFIVISWTIRSYGLEHAVEAHRECLARDLSSLPKEKRRIVIEAIVRAHISVLNFVLLTSPVFFPIVGPCNFVVNRLGSARIKRASDRKLVPISSLGNSRQFKNGQLRRLVHYRSVKRALQVFDAAAEMFTGGRLVHAA